MNDETKKKRLIKAENFIKARLKGENPTPKKLADVLKACAEEYRPDSWRNIKLALITHQKEMGFSKAVERLEATKNPITLKGEDGKLLTPDKIKKKQKRVKSIKIADEVKIFERLDNTGDVESKAAITIGKITGARPTEMHSIEIENNKIYITGAKVSEDGLRGADRVLKFIDPDTQRDLENALQVLREGASSMKQIQDRVRLASKACFPKRSSNHSLNTWRHQMGANLKGGGQFNRKGMAYIMGHQATSSVDEYGNGKAANGKSLVEPDNDNIDNDAIRENHTDVPGTNVILTPAQKAKGITAFSVGIYKENAIKSQKNQGSTRKLQVDGGYGMG